MTTRDKIDLYIANDLEELNKRAEDNPSMEKTKTASCAQITNLIEVTWTEAKKAEVNRDEERAYILYMRLYTCFIALTKAKDVATNKSTVQHYQKGAIIWFEKAEQLSESLKARYDVKNAAKIEEQRRIQAEIDEENALGKSISPKTLYKYLHEKKKSILLIDMRLKPDYDQSHMLNPACIHIPADLMNGKGWTTWGVESTLTDGEALRKFKQRADFDFIILFDEDSYEDKLEPGNALLGLKQAIFLLDRDVKLKREPLIISGGYEDWMAFYPGLSSGPLVSKKSAGQLQSFEVSYPDDEILPQEVPSDAATIVQPEAAFIAPAVVPQFDRTRKPMNNLKPESPTIEKQELPIEPVEEQQPPPPPVEVKEQPQIPDRSIKPVPTPSISQEPASVPIVPEIPVRPVNNVTPSIPKPINTNENKDDADRENIPPKDPPRLNVPNREALSIYRPFNRTVPVNNTNKQFQIRYDAATGRKIIYDTKTNQIIQDIPETETPKPVTQPIPTINRDIKPVLTEQMRRQIAHDYQAIPDNSSNNRPTGLKNLGNSCYMNSVIQSLSFNFRLTNYFLNGNFNKDINVKNKLGSRGAVVKEWFNLNVLLWSQQYSYIIPQPFKYTVGRIQQLYLGTQQQDAHEFFIFLLDALHEDLNQATRPCIEDIKSEGLTDQQLAEVAKKDFRSYNKSIIVDLFYGLFKSITLCRSCLYKSVRFEPFVIISIPIPPVRQCSINDCLELFLEGEHLRGEGYKCSGCGRTTEKNRKFEIWELPQIFIVHFKRFRLQQTHYIKNETLIRYPISNVDFPRWSRTPSSSRYSLVAVINHFGSMNSGHYTSYCNDGKQWYYCDDQSIRVADIRELDNNVHAYILIYSSITKEPLQRPIIQK